MNTQSKDEVSRLLMDWRSRDRTALDRLIPLVHEELCRLARNYLRVERIDHTLRPTGLVNKAYLLINYRDMQLAESRALLCRTSAVDAAHTGRSRSRA